MKVLPLIAFFSVLLSTKQNCKNKSKNTVTAVSGCYKGKLEVKGGCMNYTISIAGRNFDTSLVVANWNDENTGKSYQNVFVLNSRCTFPGNINEGDEFYFVLDSTTVQTCAVCLMYYPVPPKKMSIKVIEGPCKQ